MPMKTNLLSYLPQRRLVLDCTLIRIRMHQHMMVVGRPVQHDEPHIDLEPDVYATTMIQPLITQPLSLILNGHYDHHGLDMEGDESQCDEMESYLYNHDVRNVVCE